MHNQDKERRAVNWRVLRELKDIKTGIVVRVFKSDAFYPRYTIAINRILPTLEGETWTLPFIPMNIEEDPATYQKKVSHEVKSVLIDLLSHAEDFIQADADENAGRREAERIQHEKRQAGRGPKQPAGLKTLAKQDKAKREAAQKAAG
jgi:hypothetical protein